REKAGRKRGFQFACRTAGTLRSGRALNTCTGAPRTIRLPPNIPRSWAVLASARYLASTTGYGTFAEVVHSPTLENKPKTGGLVRVRSYWGSPTLPRDHSRISSALSPHGK